MQQKCNKNATKMQQKCEPKMQQKCEQKCGHESTKYAGQAPKSSVS